MAQHSCLVWASSRFQDYIYLHLEIVLSHFHYLSCKEGFNVPVAMKMRVGSETDLPSLDSLATRRRSAECCLLSRNATTDFPLCFSPSPHLRTKREDGKYKAWLVGEAGQCILVIPPLGLRSCDLGPRGRTCGGEGAWAQARARGARGSRSAAWPAAPGPQAPRAKESVS